MPLRPLKDLRMNYNLQQFFHLALSIGGVLLLTGLYLLTIFLIIKMVDLLFYYINKD